MDDLFGSFAGLPLHPLVVHGVVVLLPLMAVLTVLVAALRRWHRGAWPVVAGNLAVTLLAVVARESGRRLRAAQVLPSEEVDRHADLGEVLPLFALGVLAASLVVALVRSSRTLRRVGVVLAVVAAAAAITWTVRTGHSGAVAVWGDVRV